VTAPFYYKTGEKARGGRFVHGLDIFSPRACAMLDTGALVSKQYPSRDKRDDVLVMDRRAAVENGPTEVATQGAYFSYLLRLWREGEETAGWRASLHDPRTGARLGFASLDDLVAYLRQKTDAEPGPQAGNG